MNTITPTRSGEAYQALKRMIYAGELLPGQWLRKRDIAERLEMSPTPVVEAFYRLEREGFVMVVPHGGARVRSWTVDQIAEGLEMRAVMEGLAAARCATVADPSRLAELRPLAEKLDRDNDIFCDAKQRSPIQPGMANTDDWRFHRAISHLSGFHMVGQEIERLHLFDVTCRMFVYPLEPCPVSHVAVIDAIVQRNAPAAEDLMRRHVRSSGYVLPRLRERFGDGAVVFQLPKPGEATPPDRGASGGQ